MQGMVNKHRHRKGKIITGGHSTPDKVGGLRQLCARIEAWPEVHSIRLGAVRRRRGGPGGIRLHPTTWATWGGTVYGVRCLASSGAFLQEIVLTTSDPEGLARRLAAEGHPIPQQDPRP